MTRSPLRAPIPPLRAFPVLLAAAIGLASARPALAQPPTPDTASAAVRPAGAPPAPPPRADSASAAALAGRAAADGLENVAAVAEPPRLEFENRRFRHSADVLGRLSRLAFPLEMVERRLDLPVAAVRLDSAGAPVSVRYPFEWPGPAPAVPPRLRSTHRTLDLLVGPLVTFELGRIYDASEVRLEIQPQLVANPWSGGRLRAGWIIPVSNEFRPTPLHPDIGHPRPGPVTIEQYAWWPRVGLASGTAGLLGENRWGTSFGLARPLAQGAVLLDAQIDHTGFFAWESDGITYSEPSLWTGFAGVTLRPPQLDVALRARAARYLYGDEGVEVELRRGMGDVDLAFFAAWSDGVQVSGVRLTLPVPPMTRPTGTPLRVLPVPSFTMEYRDEAAPYAVGLAEGASREAFLDDLSLPGLRANAGRIRASRDGARTPPPTTDLEASFSGTTGFLLTPHWRVLGDRQVEAGYGRLSAGGAWDHRDESPNEVWYATVGYLPRTEIGLRWTVIPGLKSFETVVPDSRLTDADRMLSARLALLEPSGWRPGVAIGVDDVSGTRRFHSTYAIAGTTGRIHSLRVGLGGGYAPPALTATRHVLDGGFGALEVALPPHARVVVEHDSEKWNAGFGLTVIGHLKLRAAWIDLRHPAVGIGWSMHL